MTSPHFVVHRNDSGAFVVERTEPASDLARALLTGVGALLVIRGARRSGLISGLAVLAGAEMICRGWQGKSLLHLFGIATSNKNIGPESQKVDKVETASMESFPASDPPAVHQSKPSTHRFDFLKGDQNVDGK